MNAVGANHEVRFDLAAIGKTRNGAVCARCDRDAAQPKPDVGRSQPVRQNPEQIGAMNRDARRAEFLAIVALIAARDFASVPPRANDGKFRRIGRGIDLVLEAERTQRLDGVRRKPNAGADLGKLRRLLADNDLGTLALERKRRRKPADPAANDKNARCARHLPSLRLNPATVCSAGPRCQSAGPQTRDAYMKKTAPFTSLSSLPGLTRQSMLRPRFGGRTRSSTRPPIPHGYAGQARV
jgi:hypothetical protein